MTSQTMPLAARVSERQSALPEAMAVVARFLVKEPIAALSLSAAQIGAATHTSDATVVRTAKALGFSGLADLRATIAANLTGNDTPAGNMVRTLATAGSDSITAIDSVLAVLEEGLANLASAQLRKQLAEAVSVLFPATGIAVFGIGQTAPLASYAALLLNRVGRQTRLCNHSGIALADQLLAVQPGDVVLAMAYGQAYPEIEAVFQAAADLGVPVVLVSDSLDEKLASQARVVVPARRGRSGEVGLHATTLAALEAIVMGLSAGSPHQAIATLLNLGSLRNRLRGRKQPNRRSGAGSSRTSAD